LRFFITSAADDCVEEIDDGADTKREEDALFDEAIIESLIYRVGER
jgi:hypothetical protein